MANEMSFDESMELCLRDFQSAVRSVLQSPQEIFGEFGAHLGVAWELRQELLSGEPLLNWRKISDRQKKVIEGIISATKALSLDATAGEGLGDLMDPSWEAVREAAENLEIHSDR
jgi:hypothetical protein